MSAAKLSCTGARAMWRIGNLLQKRHFKMFKALELSEGHCMG